ncbi:hypothetical protein KCP78_11315 [Salmonella enterica subsp. enterica]|nr:hypothetical protein KCP78_11315 [Salmonella enterica subsp. enterica]
MEIAAPLSTWRRVIKQKRKHRFLIPLTLKLSGHLLVLCALASVTRNIISSDRWISSGSLPQMGSGVSSSMSLE